jgi:DNA polymerase-3 subunit alpha
MTALVEERNANGPYLDVYDFVERQDPSFCNRRIIEALAKSGAFDEIHPNRAEVVANVSVLLGLMQSTFEQKNSDQIGLFGLSGEEEEAPTLSRPDLTFVNQWDKFEKLKQELSSLGFYLSSHPLEAYADVLRDVDGLVEINTLEDRATEGGVIVKVAGVIAAKRIRKTKTGKRMAILHLSDRSGQDEIAVFPESYEAYADLIDANVPLLAHLSVSLDEDRLRVSVERLENLEDVAQGPSEIELILRDVDAAKILKEYMEPLTSGRTKPLLKVQIPGRGQVHLKLKKGLKVTKPFLAKAETLTQ